MTSPALKPGTGKVIERFLSEKLRKTKASGYVVGVSGGIDSAVVLRLATRAVGNDSVLGVIMPESESPEEDRHDAEMLCGLDNVPFETIDITPMVEGFSSCTGREVDRRDLANVKARCRMTVLYYFAGSQGRLVLGTSNKSEMLIGYFTKYGDGGADLEPIGDLYKTQVRQLAREIGIPDRIVDKAPSAGLWKGQTDEGEIGMTYDALDSILHGMELGLGEGAIVDRAGTSVEEVRRVASMVRSSAHKRRTPPVVKIGLRTPGFDWREADEDV
jgi:NAD+ synthase